MEYYNLKLEHKNNYRDSYYTESLSYMLSDYNKFDNFHAFKIIKSFIGQTKTPIEFLKVIKKSIQ